MHDSSPVLVAESHDPPPRAAWPSLHVEIVQAGRATALLNDETFRTAWLHLWERCPWGTAFQRPDFGSVWYAVYAERFAPVLILSHDATGELCGLLPLARSWDGRRLVAAGAHQAEYQVWLALPEIGDAFSRLALRAVRTAWPSARMTLQHLPPGTPRAWLADPEMQRMCRLTSHRRPLWHLGDGTQVARSLKKRGNRNRINRLRREGTLEFRRLDDADELEARIDEIIRCYDARQMVLHGSAPFRNDPLKRAFHLALARQTDLLHATVLTVGQRLASANLNIRGAGEVHLGIPAHNPLWVRHSPGKLHKLFLAELLVREGCDRIDLTPGDDPYKDHFANDADEVHTLSLFPSGPYRWGADLCDGLKQQARRALRTLSASLRYRKPGRPPDDAAP